MRIAIASADGVRIFHHFGRTPSFAIIEVESGQVTRRTIRTNDFTPHAQRAPGADRHHDHHHATHGHAAIAEALKDCQVVISRGMGRRAYEDLRAAGIEMIVTDEVQVESAVSRYLAGTLTDRTDRLHDHGHSRH
jgi:predicted Fe-Mo cluster-binding NifX family protein